jgi:hypothetical protein
LIRPGQKQACIQGRANARSVSGTDVGAMNRESFSTSPGKDLAIR